MDDHWARLETRIGDIEADLQKVKTYVDAVVGTSLDGYTAVQHIKGLIKFFKNTKSDKCSRYFAQNQSTSHQYRQIICSTMM